MGRTNEGLSARSNGIDSLMPHHRCMARDLAIGGLRPMDLAAFYGISGSQISAIIGSPCFQAELKRYEDQMTEASLSVVQELKSMLPKALSNLSEDLCLVPENPAERKLRQNVSLEILDRVLPKSNQPALGVGNVVQINVENMSVGDLQRDIFAKLEEPV